MRSKTTSIRLRPETREWLERHKRPFAQQLEADLENLQILIRMATLDTERLHRLRDVLESLSVIPPAGS